jgi:hypothetical protein
VKLPLLRLLLIRMLPASAGLRRVARARRSTSLPLTLRLTLTLTWALPLALALAVALTLSGTWMPVLGGQHDLELVQLVPFRVSSILFRNRTQRLQPCARRIRLWFVHDGIISPSGHRESHANRFIARATAIGGTHGLQPISIGTESW